MTTGEPADEGAPGVDERRRGADEGRPGGDERRRAAAAGTAWFASRDGPPRSDGGAPSETWRRGRRRGPPPWIATGGEPPPWWPSNEPWRHRRRPRGFGCLFGILFLVGVLGLVSLGASVLGGIIAAPGLPGHGIRIVALLVTLVVGFVLVRTAAAIRRTAAVLDQVVEQAGRVERGDYAARVTGDDRTPRPVRALVRGFNTMADRLETDEVQRRRLLADVTHELRTPLTVISGNVEAILDGVHPADASHLTTILDETRVLSRLVDDLRTLALSEAGSLSLHREPTDLDVLVADVAASFAGQAETARVAIETNVADDVPLLDVDPVRIREVLGNLIANALRHTPPGGRIGITATVSTRAPEPDGVVEIVVRDTGDGIDPALLPRIFDRFARGPESPGSGLGLSISRGLVELHGGTISAASPDEGGTEIRIRLPLAAS